MAIRMTGMYSNLDTDSIISELMKAQRTKIDKVEKAKTKTEWKVDAWSTLNSKVYSFYTGSLSNMRFTNAYNKKATSISDSTIATVTASNTGVEGTQDLAVKKLAKSGYLTGGVMSTNDSSTLASTTKLGKLGSYTTGTATLKVQLGSGTSKDISLSENSSISDVITQLQSAGVNASFDATNKRIFVSSTTTGAAADFDITGSDANGNIALRALGLDTSPGIPQATKIDGQDAEIELNGATFTSTSNSFSINGLNIVTKGLSASSVDGLGNTTYTSSSVTTTRDYQSIYDSVKSFIKEYNTLINEMDSLYNADSAKGYEPLTDDEKEAMSDSQIEKWESKIKDALLRRDNNLGTVSSTMKTAMAKSYTIDGTNYSLASFGIATGSYFSTDADERSAFHIDGDSSDSTVSSNTDKLMTAISKDPDKVMSFFTSLSKGLYDAVGKNMNAVTGVRTKYKIYDDQSMSSQIDDYEDEIDDLEDKFKEMENRYYSQYAAMETALSKLQSSTSSLSSLLGSS